MASPQQQSTTNQTSPAPSEGSRRKKGSGFTNLQRILGANQGAGERLGSTLRSGVEDRAQTARDRLGASQSQFQQGVGQSQSRIQGINQGAQESFNTAENAPTQIGNTDTDRFEGIRNLTYQGPDGLQNANEIKEVGREAETLGELSRNREGRMELLRQFARQGASPQYTQRRQALDELILGSDGERSLKQARRASQGLEGQIDTATQSAETLGQEQARQVGLSRQNILGELDTRRGASNTDISNSLSQAQNLETERAAGIGTFRQGFASGNQDVAYQGLVQAGVPEADASYVKKLMNSGTSPEVINRFINDSMAQNLTRDAVATDEQLLRENALSKLAGQNSNVYEGPDYQAGQAGVKEGLETEALRVAGSKNAQEIGRELGIGLTHDINQNLDNVLSDLKNAQADYLSWPEQLVDPNMRGIWVRPTAGVTSSGGSTVSGFSSGTSTMLSPNQLQNRINAIENYLNQFRR